MKDPRTPNPAYRFYSAKRSLRDILKLAPSVFDAEDHHARQFEYVSDYVKRMNCGTVVVESHYVDRDYMEEHSVFYSRALAGVPNYCQRVHFFTAQPQAVRRSLTRLLGMLRTPDYERACRSFSEETYLGFTVIRPLHGSPVGRTVLRAPDVTGRIATTHRYPVHLLGTTLKVEGLAFQQQDIGVSACATTALWTSLQNAATFEDIAPVAPAQITALASRFALPFGRSMPSEGLSAAQMSQAIQGVGLSPNLLRVADSDHARRLLLAMALSGFAPVLLLKAPEVEDYHAVVLSGVDVRTTGPFEVPTAQGAIVEASSLVTGFSINDDRIGPYVPATIDASRTDGTITIQPPTTYGELRLQWKLTHILVALHTKIRFSFGGLQTAMTRIIRRVTDILPKIPLRSDEPAIFVEAWIERGHTYITQLIADAATGSLPLDLLSAFPLPRYVAIVRMGGKLIGTIDVLFDTTSTERNLVVLGVVRHRDTGPIAADVATTLAKYLRCKAVEV
jgi:hypothetical protein